MRRVLIVVAILAAVAFAAWRFLRRESPPPVPAGVDSVSAAGVRSVELWFGAPSGESLERESRDVVETPTIHERVRDLIAELEKGPGKNGVRTLPHGTTLLHAYLDDRGLLTVDLSRAFQQDFRGGAGAEYLTLTSLVRTLAANLPEVRRVMIVCGGAPIPSLAGHLPLDRPLDVADWH
jgi:hypothetical protein